MAAGPYPPLGSGGNGTGGSGDSQLDQDSNKALMELQQQAAGLAAGHGASYAGIRGYSPAQGPGGAAAAAAAAAGAYHFPMNSSVHNSYSSYSLGSYPNVGQCPSPTRDGKPNNDTLASATGTIIVIPSNRRFKDDKRKEKRKWKMN